MLLDTNTPVEVRTDNGGFARGRLASPVQVCAASDGISVCGGVDIFCPGQKGPQGKSISIPAHRLAHFRVREG